MGTYDVNTGTFASIASGGNDTFGFGPGFFSNNLLTDTRAIEGQQLAMRWSKAASGLSAIMYYDITAGGDATFTANWTVRAGDGSGIDVAGNPIDVADLTTPGTYLGLVPEARLIGATFAGSNSQGVPSFQLIPEPSTYAVFAGLLAFGLVAIQRRRRA